MDRKRKPRPHGSVWALSGHEGTRDELSDKKGCPLQYLHEEEAQERCGIHNPRRIPRIRPLHREADENAVFRPRRAEGTDRAVLRRVPRGRGCRSTAEAARGDGRAGGHRPARRARQTALPRGGGQELDRRLRHASRNIRKRGEGTGGKREDARRSLRRLHEIPYRKEPGLRTDAQKPPGRVRGRIRTGDRPGRHHRRSRRQEP